MQAKSSATLMFLLAPTQEIYTWLTLTEISNIWKKI